MYAAAIGLVLIAVFVPLSSLTLKGKGVVRTAMAPAERGASSLWQWASGTMAAIRGIGGAAEKNRELRHELTRTRAELDNLRGVEADNLRLQRALDFRQVNPHVLIPCNVVSRSISGWWETVRIGKGLRDGVRTNSAVISPDGLVGRTTEVTLLAAEVLLVSDPACRVSAKLARANVFGLVRGMGNTLKGEPKARMEFINKDTEIRLGDEIVTSGLSSGSGEFPKGVHIGYVEKVYIDASGLFQYADIIPRATVGLLDYVFVVGEAKEGG
ncbi:MAG: rod shape-determining protein MreC [Pontiella sp.]